MIKFPHYIVGDEAFPLRRNLLRPYGGRNLPSDKQKFNSSLSTARRTIENSFSIMVSKFRIYHTTLIANPEVAMSIIKATVVLHNFIRKTGHSFDQAEQYEECNLTNIGQVSSNNSTREATFTRDLLKSYLNENIIN